MTKTQSTPETLELSSDRQINELLNDVVGRLKEYAESQTKHINQLAKIGVALSSTVKLDNLLEMIVDQARSFTRSDGGTLYLVSDDEQSLNFTIVQNETLKTRMGGATGEPINWPPVPLTIDGKPNNFNVCAYAANSGEIVNIPDVYEAEGFNFEGTRKFDAGTGYRSKSMLVIPMRDHEGEIIGVLQLINARDPSTRETLPFAPEFLELTASLASQAAVAITNARLIRDLQNLFESFIKTIATAIDEKSPYTGGHISRVANLTMEIADRINQAEEGPYADTHFTEDELTELRLAAWLHDTGKITTPEYVVDKRTKLETIFDRKELVRLRFELAIVNSRLKTVELGAALPHSTGDDVELKRLISETEQRCQKLLDDARFVLNCNTTQEFVPDEVIERLKGIAGSSIETSEGQEQLLSDDELQNLEIRKGNLTTEERKIIEDHVVVTKKMLGQLPFPKKMRNVPFIAGAHHEKLNGKGYPDGLTADQIPLQVRIMTLADIFEALTAKDRPYKPAKNMSEVLKILGFMVKDGELDGDLVQFFTDQKMHIEYAHQHLDPSQLDIE